MAGFTFDIDTGQIDVGDTKTLTVAPRDDGGSLVQLSSLTLEIEEAGGTTTTYALGDMTQQSGPTYDTEHTFTEAGIANFDVTVTDMGGRTERETATEYIHA